MDMRHVIELLKRADLHDEAAAVGIVMQQRAELLESLKNVERADFLKERMQEIEKKREEWSWGIHIESDDYAKQWQSIAEAYYSLLDQRKAAITKAEAAE